MQPLTASASVSKRKQACKSCRQRKRRCDAKRPACSLCGKWGLVCEYGAIASPERIDTRHSIRQYPSIPLLDQNPGSLPHDQISTGLSDLDQVLKDQHLDLPHPGLQQTPLQISSLAYNWRFDSFSTDVDLLVPSALPPNDTLGELVEIFFNELYHCFPCFHKASLIAEIRCGQLQIDSPLLCYAICTLAATFHPNPTVRSHQGEWYDQAKLLYGSSCRDLSHPLRTIQAALCLIFHSSTSGDFSSSWLFVGKAWRQITAIEMNRLDSIPFPTNRLDDDSDAEQSGDFSHTPWSGSSIISREECRRTLWLLFMQDRAQSWPTGWAPAIPESHFKVNLPMCEVNFQSMNSSTPLSPNPNIPFNQDFNALLASLPSSKDPPNILLHLITAYILLGRIAEHIHSPHADPASPTYRAHCLALETQLVKLRLRLPRTATSISDAAPPDRPLVIWLNIILNNASILLHYRLAGLPDPSPPDETGTDTAASTEPYALALAAAKDTARTIHTTTHFSTALLLNPHIALSLYVAASVLVIHMRLADDASCAADIELFELVFARMGDVYAAIGTKLQIAMERDLRRDTGALARLKEQGVRGLLADCSGWRGVARELSRRGLPIS